MNSKNIMREIYLEKVTVNINVGNDKLGMDKAKKLLEKITGRKAKYNTAKKRIALWSIRPGLPIGYKVTLRGEKAKEFLTWILKSKKNTIKGTSFDIYGNLSIGVAEYLDLIGMKYDSEIGVLGFELTASFTRKGGLRIRDRNIKNTIIPNRHRSTKSEVQEFLKSNYEVKFV